MSKRAPYLSSKKRETISDEELMKYYDELREYYEQLPFDEKAVAKEEKYCYFLSQFFSFISHLKRIEILNADKLPNENGLICVSNHIGSFDQFFLTSVLKDFRPHYLVKDKVTTWPFRWNVLYKPTGVVVVNQSSMGSWLAAKEKLNNYLYKNRNIFIFPEGTRRGEDNLGEFFSGVGQIVQDTKKPVVTLAVKNSARMFSTVRPIVCIGETLRFDPRTSVHLITETIQDAVYHNYDEIVAYEEEKKNRQFVKKATNHK